MLCASGSAAAPAAIGVGRHQVKRIQPMRRGCRQADDQTTCCFGYGTIFVLRIYDEELRTRDQVAQCQKLREVALA